VFDSLDVWSIDTSRVHASFTAGQLSPSCFRFTNSSLNATHYLWDFGDSGSSTETNPIHCYETPGHYPVVLHAFSDCLADSASSGLVITGSGESLSDSQALLLFPNPTPGKLHIRYTGNDPAPCITVRNACGIAVALMTLTDNSCVLDLSGFSDGIYIVTGSDRQIPFSARFTIVR
jgi:PKD repeat protein